MYTINESTARIAHEMRSFSDYQPGSATAGYTAQVFQSTSSVWRTTVVYYFA